MSSETAGAGGHLGRFRTSLSASPQLWWAMLYFFCLLCGYYVLRPVRDAMGASADASAVFPRWVIAFGERHGFAVGELTLQLLFSATFLVMVLLQPLYGSLVSRLPRRAFLPAVYLAFIFCLFGFWWAFDTSAAGRGALFFVWVAVFNLFAVTVFWSFMADVFDNARAKQVYGYIGAGGTVGALLGPAITRTLVEPLGVANLLLVSAGFLGVCLLCIYKLRPWARRREEMQGRTTGQAMGGSMLAGLRLVWQRPLLRALAVLMFFGVGVGTLLYNEQAAIARAAFATAEERTAYYSMIDGAINTLTITVQVLLTRPLLQRYGIAPLLLLPALAIMAGFAMLSASPLPLLVALVQIVTRASEFSLAKPARESLYTRVDREERYKAKAVIDTVVYRGGDLTFAWAHKALSAMGSSMVFLTGLGIALGMTYGAWRVIRAERALPQDPVVEPARANSN